MGRVVATAQVVLRRAQISVTEMELDPQTGRSASNWRGISIRAANRMDLTQAPLLRFSSRTIRRHDRWVLLASTPSDRGPLYSGCAPRRGDAILAGHGDKLSPPQPFRNLVAQVRLGIAGGSRTFLPQMLGEITEPTLPFGLIDVHQDGADIVEPRVCCRRN